MARPRRVNRDQLSKVYWPAWRAAERVLIQAGFSKAEAEETRLDIHTQVTGAACSSKDLTNQTMDEVLRKFAKISDPSNGTRQAELAAGGVKRLRFAIEKLRKELGMEASAVESMATRMCKRPLEHCDETQLIKIIQALKIHDRRNS